MSERLIIEDEHEGHRFEWLIELKPSSHKPHPCVECTECGGSGHKGGHFKSFEEETECWRCHGTGKMHDYTVPQWSPQPPEELIEGLRKVWRDYWNKQQNEKFKLD